MVTEYELSEMITSLGGKIRLKNFGFLFLACLTTGCATAIRGTHEVVKGAGAVLDVATGANLNLSPNPLTVYLATDKSEREK